MEQLCDPVLKAAGFVHGFGQRGSQVPESTVFSRQVHGIDAFEATHPGGAVEIEADVVFSRSAGVSVGIVTADCVPILVAAPATGAVAAIHAGWRGLAAGVIEGGLAALRAESPTQPLVGAVGPGARGCCYEVDEPVRDALSQRYSRHMPEVLVATTPGHYLLDLPLLASRILEEGGLGAGRLGIRQRVCTICDAERFESYRREGVAAGRLKHFITHPMTIPRQG